MAKVVRQAFASFRVANQPGSMQKPNRYISIWICPKWPDNQEKFPKISRPGSTVGGFFME
jgi:hypothetical protein